MKTCIVTGCGSRLGFRSFNCELCDEGVTIPNTKEYSKRRFCSRTCSARNNGRNNKGKKHSAEANVKKALFGERNGFYGKHHTLETRKKLSNHFKKATDTPIFTRKRKDGYVIDSNDNYIHRLKMEKKLSRKFKRWEVVHHIDGNPSNNKLNNLKLMTNSEHRRMHSLKQPRGDRTWIK